MYSSIWIPSSPRWLGTVGCTPWAQKLITVRFPREDQELSLAAKVPLMGVYSAVDVNVYVVDAVGDGGAGEWL